jgi:hypothetical protein
MFTWSLSPDTDARFLTMTRQKNYALTFQMYVLILKLNLVEMDGEPDHVHLLIN